MILAARGRADRKGRTLTLHFANGRSRAYTTKGDCEGLEGDCRAYALLALVQPADFFLVRDWFYERVGCLLVDQRTGRETELPDMPYLSPDGDRLLVVNGSDGGGGYWPLQIWRRRGDAAFVEWKQSDTPTSLPEVTSVSQWHQDGRIGLTMVSVSPVEPPPAGYVPKRTSASLNLTNQGWKLRSPASPDQQEAK